MMFQQASKSAKYKNIYVVNYKEVKNSKENCLGWNKKKNKIRQAKICQGKLKNILKNNGKFLKKENKIHLYWL